MTCILRVYQDRDDSIDCQDVVCAFSDCDKWRCKSVLADRRGWIRS